MGLDKEKLQEAATKSLKVLQAVASSAAVLCPSLGFASSLIGALLKVVDKNDDGLEELKEEFEKIENDFLILTNEIQQVINEIDRNKVETQFSGVITDLMKQHKAYVKMIDAPPEDMDSRTKNFKDIFHATLRDQHLCTLYDSMTGKSLLSADPILEVCRKFSGNNRGTMIEVCNHLFYMLNIGCITMLANATLCGGNMERLQQEWEEKMKRVCEEMEKTLKDCQ